MLSVLSAAALAACAVDADKPSDPAQLAAEDAAEFGTCNLEQDPAATCRNRFTATLDDADPGTGASANTSALCFPPDMYFHPINGARSGWIEEWRLCPLGGGQYRICTGGNAPVRFWNPSSCSGDVHDFYPQGWRGWAATTSGCC